MKKIEPQKDTAENLPVDVTPLPPSTQEPKRDEEVSPSDILEIIRQRMRQAEAEREEQTRRWASASLFLQEYFACYNRGQSSLSNFRFTPPYGGEVSPQELDYVAWTVNWREFLSQHGIRCPKTEEHYWRNDPNIVKELFNVFEKTKDFDVQVKCAVLLRQCNLLVRSTLLILSLFKYQWLIVAEELAQIAVDLEFSLLRRSLAEAILAKDDVLLALVKCDARFIPFVHTLALKLGKRLEYDFSTTRWFISSY